MAVIRVLVVDDHALFRQGLVSFLNEQPDIEVVGAAGDAASAVTLAREVRPDIVLMDVNLPEEGGIEATRRILRMLPQVRVLMLTVSSADADLLEALRAGAHGYLLKSATPDEVLRGIRLAYQGQTLLSPEVAAKLVAHVRQGTLEEAHPLEGLSPREREILRLVAQGYTNAEIARLLVISENTVKTHLRRIMRKVGAANRAELAALAAKAGL